MRNATSILLFGASALGLTLLGACGGGDDGSRDDGASGSGTGVAGSTVGAAGSTVGASGSTNGAAGSTAAAGTSAGGSDAGGAPTCNPMPGAKKGDGTNLVIDDLDDTNTMFAPAGVGMGSWDFGKDTAGMGTITPLNTMLLAPTEGGHMGSALHVTGEGLTGWGASLAAFLNGTTGSFDASAYAGIAFWIKGTTTVQEGKDMLMVQARMPDVLPGAGSCCDDKVAGSECYSGHRTVIAVTADWSEVKIPWSAFQGPTWGLGASLPFNPNRIRDINFSFNHDAMGTTPTSFDVWIDGVRFMAAGEMGGGGGGGGGAGGQATGGGGAAAAGAGAGGGGAGGTAG